MTLKHRRLLTSGFTILSVVAVFGAANGRIIDKIVSRHTRSRSRNPSATPPTVVQLPQLSSGTDSAGSAPRLLLAE
jgi:hypothetical protein